jgi:hypothetical protein
MNEHDKARYVDLIARGALRYEAARQMNITLRTVKKHYFADPDFREAVEDAVLEAAEPVEAFLRDAALKDPNISLKYLKAVDNERWGDRPQQVNVSVKHGLDPDLAPALAEAGLLIAQLQDRRALRAPYEGRPPEIEPTAEIIQDAEVIEELDSTDANEPVRPATVVPRPTAPPIN